MGDPYTDVSVQNYNQNPPPDDGTATDDNEIKWATHKNKLADPLKTAIEGLNANIGAAVDRLPGGGGVTAVATTQSLGESVQGKLVRVTAGAITVTTPDAATVGAPFVFALANNSNGAITLDGNGAQTIDGAASLTVTPSSGLILTTDGTNWFSWGQNFTAPYPRGHIGGLQLSNAADADHDVTVSAGSARDSTDTINLDIAGGITKQIDVNWAPGDDAGGFPSGLSLAAGTWYHVFLVDDGAGGTDAGFDTSLTASNLLSDAGGSFYRRIGSVLTDGSLNILAFTQIGDEFLWADPPLDRNGANVGTTAVLVALSVPLGVKVKAHFNVSRRGFNGGDQSYISSPDQNDEGPSQNTAPLATAGTEADTANADINEQGFHATVLTNTSSQVRYRANQSEDVYIATTGWTDTRGRHD